MRQVRGGMGRIRKTISRSVIIVLVIFILAGMMVIPSWVSQAQAQSTGPFIPIILKNGTMEPSDTITPSPTFTFTSTPITPTVTGTPPTATFTNTAGPSPTNTLTPSPTVTGTLVPNALITNSVSPLSAYVNQNLVFTIKVANSGTGPTYNNVVTDQFDTRLDLVSVTTTQGSVNKLTRQFVVTIGTVYPGNIITIIATVKVNSSVTSSVTTTNYAVLTYDNTSKTAGVSYTVLYQTLPGTGELPLNWREANVKPLTMIPGLLLMIAGGALLVLVVSWSKARSSKYKVWLTVGGSLLFVVGFVAAVTSSGLFRSNPQISLLDMTPTAPGSLAEAQSSATLEHRSAWEFSTPDADAPILTLPDYPVPSPVVTVTPKPGEPGPDTSEVNRIVIPVINLDTVVKYVPFDGYTWKIAGLRQEVAWMGDTSWPGLGSNTGLAGHVTVAGMGDGPFRHLEELPVGELVLIYTEKNIYTYQVRESKITTDDDLSVVDPSIDPQISLITCVDWDTQTNTYLNRLVVIADLIRTDPLTITMAP